ncbi:MAG: amidase family protein [Acidimicrobiia bacterium]|nr:amidase family protein [Acidimicrobiia bacterium]
MDFRTHRLVDLAAKVRSRELSAREVTEASLARIEQLDPELNAFVSVDAERALAEAVAIDDRLVNEGGVGLLAGMPLAVKDLEDAEGFPTRYGSVLTSDKPAHGDSVLVARLRAAGCVVVGKTTTPEYGHKGVTDSPLSGVTRNPWSVDRSPGGSSGGSAAALASGMVPLATGSDGGGSIRIPSALCGLTSIKTTQGRVPNGGPTPPGSGLLSVKGPMARRIDDVVFALDVCVGPHPTDPFSLPRSGAPWYDAMDTKRLPSIVAWSPTLGYAEVDEEIAGICEAAIERLAEAGAGVEVVDEVWPADPAAPWYTMWAASRARTQGHLIGTPEYEQISESLRGQIEAGMGLSAADLARSIDAVHELNLQLDAAFERAPLLLTPVCAGHTPVIDEGASRYGVVNGIEVPGWVAFTYGLNMTRNPAGTINVGYTADGMPVGLQVIGRQRDDLAVLQALSAMEDVFGTDRVAEID